MTARANETLNWTNASDKDVIKVERLASAAICRHRGAGESTARQLAPRYAEHTVSETQKALEQAIARILKPLGYRKRATTWHCDRGEVVSVLNLQKSQWGDDWYLNLGVYLKGLGDETRPAEARCHVRCRAGTLAGREMPKDPIGLAALVEEVALPWLEAMGTERGVADFLGSERSSVCFVDRRVRERLGPYSDAPSA